MRLDANKIIKNFLIKSLGLDKYQFLLDNKDTITISSDHDFARVFNSYFKVRKAFRWQHAFFDVFELNKNNVDITFKELLEQVYNQVRTFEASYVSKMLHLINPNKPIWDKYVLNYYGLKSPHGKDSERIEKISKVYHQLEINTQKELNKDSVQKQLDIFDQWLPEYTHISSVKKLDTLIWKIRE